MGGFKFVTKGDSSLHGEVSRDDAVLEPPPPLGEWIPTGACWYSSDGIIRLKPEAEALLTTERERCFDVVVTFCDRLTGDSSRVFSDDDVPVSKLLDNKLCNNKYI